jgi:tetratricopeptide (TPR) repeat protein
MTVLAAGKAIAFNENIPMPLRLGNALVSCAVYMRQMVWPEGLAVSYPYPHYGLPPWEVALAGTLLAGFSAVAWGERRTRPWLLMGWLWYLGVLAPMIGIVQVGTFAHADRFTYLSQIGIYIAVTWLVAEWRVSRAAIGGLMAGLLALFMVCAWQQTAYWQNSETLWTYTLACTTDNDIAQDNLGIVLMQKGRMDSAITCFQQALRIRPDFPEARNNLGYALLQMGKVDAAITCFQKALQIRPDFAEAHDNLGYALLQTGRVEDAIAQCQQALQIKPDDAEACVNLGNALFRKGRADDAIAQYRKALQIKPGLAMARKNLGAVLRQKSGRQAIP